MVPCKVVILSGYSLLAEGTASLLRNESPALEIHVIDPHEPETHSRIRDLQPSAVIWDSSDHSLREVCQVDALLKTTPHLRIIQLDPERDRVQIVTGEERLATCAADLLKAICAEIT